LRITICYIHEHFVPRNKNNSGYLPLYQIIIYIYKIMKDEKRNHVDNKRQSEIEMKYTHSFSFANTEKKKRLDTSLSMTR